MCVHNTYKSSVLKTESVFITDFFLLYAVFITGTYGVHNRYNGVHNRVFIIQCSYKSQSNGGIGGIGGKLQCRSHAAMKSAQALLWLIAML